VTLTDSRNKTTETRLAPRPLYEYSVPKPSATTGAIFSFVVATDPEAILMVESFDEKGKSGFRFAFARFHFWRVTATLGEATVWDVEFDASMPNNLFARPETVKKVYNSYLVP